MQTKKLLVVAAIAIVVIAAGCGRSRTYVGPGGNVTVREKGNSKRVEVQTDKGKATIDTEKKTITEQELGVPVYPGATVEVSSNFEGNESGKTEAMQNNILTTPDDFDKVSAFYKTNLKNVKSSMTQDMGEGKMSMFSLKSEDGSDISVNITSDKDKKITRIQVMKMTKK